MNHALDQAQDDGARALVITGRDRFFSGGLDLKTLPILEKPVLKSVLKEFAQVMQRVFLFPSPVVCAAGGHALAGGMVLYLAGDVRIAVSDDTFRMGLNEVAIGVPFPRWLAAQCALSIPSRYQTRLLLHAEVMAPEVSFVHGITHALANSNEALLPMALSRAEELACLDPAAYRITKLRLRGPILEGCAEMSPEELDEFAGSRPFDRTRTAL
jgi:enoyl-CoA hydratase